MKSQHEGAVAELLGESLWMMEPRALRSVVRRLELAGAIPMGESIVAMRDTPRTVGTMAVIDVCGAITYRPSWFSDYFGGSTIMSLQAQFRAALADPSVKTICFRFDSPGGTVDMVPEFAAEIFAARGVKPIVAVADVLVASAAYWLAAQCDAIYTSVSGQLGSIGVYTTHEDYSALMEKAGIKVTFIANGAHKVDGHPYAPLPADVQAEIQSRVDEVGAEFVADVARGRGRTPKQVLAGFGQGKLFRGKRAIAAGLADKLGTLGGVVAKMAGVKGAAVASPVVAALPMRADDDAPNDPPEAPEVEPVEPCDLCGDDCACEHAGGRCDTDCATCSAGCPCLASSVEDTSEAEALALLLSVRR